MGIHRNKESLAVPTPEIVSSQIVEACQEAKGREINILDVSEVFGLSDYFVIASGRSDRQVQGIANRVLEKMEKMGVPLLSLEGFDQGHWILMDFGEVIVHVFYEQVRKHYDIESLWVDARSVDLKELEDKRAA